MQQGAQDYLLKGRVHGDLLVRSLRYAIERKQVEQRLADFSAMIVHDLRAPLASVVLTTSILHDGLTGPVNEEQKQWLEKIESNVRKVIQLVNDFLDLSKLEAGHIELIKEEVDLKQLIQGCLENHLLLAQDKKIALTSRVEPTLPPTHADPRRLEQVLTNLVTNAVKFTGEGGAIEVGACHEDGKGIRVWMKDSGMGIPPDEIGSLFQKYCQTSSGKDSKHKGAGLGLVICKMVVEAHGGKIRVESEEGKGSTFTFILPF